MLFVCNVNSGDGPGGRERPPHEGGHAGAQLGAGEGPAHHTGQSVRAVASLGGGECDGGGDGGCCWVGGS